MILCLPVCEVGGQSAFLGRVALMPVAKGIGSLVAAAWSAMEMAARARLFPPR